MYINAILYNIVQKCSLTYFYYARFGCKSVSIYQIQGYCLDAGKADTMQDSSWFDKGSFIERIVCCQFEPSRIQFRMMNEADVKPLVKQNTHCGVKTKL